MIWFEIPGKAVGKGRPRFTKNGHTYTPDATRSYEDLVKVCYTIATDREPPTDKAVAVYITVWMVPAKSLSKKKKAELTERPPMNKPDVDNIAKIVLDALNGVAWKDDKQVTALEIIKLWGHEERVMVGIKKEGEYE